MADFETIWSGRLAFAEKLKTIKTESQTDIRWYKYDTMSNLGHLRPMISPQVDAIFSNGKTIADIGAADGDLAFYLESLGYHCDIYDFASTNMNGLRGAKFLKETLSSSNNIFNIDLDSQFEIGTQYDFILMLGILYHLKNPFFVLETLAKRTDTLFISTKIARHPAEGGPDIANYPLAYLLGPSESNNDPTNYWVFTEAGIKRLFERSGWSILDCKVRGDLEHSNPQDPSRNQRIFAILQSKFRSG